MGDPVCWLGQTCLSCGRFLGEASEEGGGCPHCGADRLPPADESPVPRPGPAKEPSVPFGNPSPDQLRTIFRDARVIAVVGASEDPGKPANSVPAYLQQQGYRIVAVNPGGGEILGEEAVDRLAGVEEPIDVVDVFRPAEETPGIAEEAVEAGAKVLWLQTGIASDEAASIAGDGGLTVVMDVCMGETHRKLGLGPGPHPG